MWALDQDRKSDHNERWWIADGVHLQHAHAAAEGRAILRSWWQLSKELTESIPVRGRLSCLSSYVHLLVHHDWSSSGVGVDEDRDDYLRPPRQRDSDQLRARGRDEPPDAEIL